MTFPTFRLYFDNVPADQDRLTLFTEIRVDQAIGMAAEAELALPVLVDGDGVWDAITDDFVAPFKRVRIEVKVGDSDFAALIDGSIVGQRFELSAESSENRMTLVVQDDSMLLNREESVRVFPPMSDDAIVSTLFGEASLIPEVESVPDAGAVFERAVVQRGTPMQLIRDLARQHGMHAYVKPGPTPGTSVGVFAKPVLAPSDLPELLLLGADRNIDRFSAEFDALRPTTAKAGSVTISDVAVQTAQATSSSLTPMDGQAVGDLFSQLGATHLVRTREEKNDIDAAVQAAVDLSSFAYSASAEVDSQIYPAVLRPYVVVKVAGVGPHLSGDYLVSRVTHVLNMQSYRQRFSLRRNARGSASAGGGGLGGII